MQVGGPATTWAAPGLDRGDRHDQGFESVHVVGARSGDRDRNWQPGAIGQGVDLRAGLASVDGAGTSQWPPFLARTQALSTIARLQSMRPRLPSSSSTAWCNRRQSPSLVHALKRRCAVWNGTPNDGGRSRQAQPLVSTYTTAVKTARPSSGAVPPPCGRGSNAGINGSTNAHNSSGTSRNDNRSTTPRSWPTWPQSPRKTRSKWAMSFPPNRGGLLYAARLAASVA